MRERLITNPPTLSETPPIAGGSFVTITEVVKRLWVDMGTHTAKAIAQVRELLTRPKEPSVIEAMIVVLKVAFVILAWYHGMKWFFLYHIVWTDFRWLFVLLVMLEFAFASGAVLEKIVRQIIGLSRIE